MNIKGTEVVIVGGGLVGLSTAYLLGLEGVKSVIVERDSIGSHASGFAYGGVGGWGVPEPTSTINKEGWRLHREFADALPEETGINFDFRARATLYLAFNDGEAQALRSDLLWRQQEPGNRIRWVDAAEARAIEPRVSQEAIGGTYDESGADLEPYRLLLALAQQSEKLGATFQHGSVRGLKRQGGRVKAVLLDNGEIPCEHVVLSMGPWSGEASSWLGTPVPIRPNKGQILRLQAPGPPIRTSIGWLNNYAITKPDGLLWTGTTQENADFDDRPTTKARDQIMSSLLKMLPYAADARLGQHTACLRPLSGDGLLILGSVSGWEGVYVATGANGQGIRLGPGMARVVVDLITKGVTDIPIDAFNPDRFATATDQRRTSHPGSS